MFRLKNTNNRLKIIGKILVDGLKDELKNQKHTATGALERSIKYIRQNPRGISGIRLDVISTLNKSYWQVVNNPSRHTFQVSIPALKKWVVNKGIPLNALYAIYNKLVGNKNTNRRGYYGRPYVYWTEGNNIRRTDFAGYTKRKFKKQIVSEIQVGVGQDAVQMIRDNIKKYIPNREVQNRGFLR
tara:strand:- start:2423 stop:2977 length:555 start_codon:yes stop_codon:yes gene_type:complete